MSYDLSALTEWVEEPGNVEDFFMKSVMEAQTMQVVNVMPGLKGKKNLPNLESDYDIFQDGDGCTISPKGDVRIDQRQLDPRNLLTFLELCPRDLEAYFTRQTLPAGSNYENLGALEGLILMEHARQIRKAIEISVWNGEEGGASPIASNNLFDGFLHRVDDAITAAEIPAAQQLAGATDVANIIDTVEAMRDSLPPDQYWEGDDSQPARYVMYMSHAAKVNYERAYRSTFGALPYNTRFNKQVIDGSNIELVGLNGLYNTVNNTQNVDNIILAKRESMWVGVDIDGEDVDFDVFLDEYRENVRIKSRFKMATQINFPEEFVVNGF